MHQRQVGAQGRGRRLTQTWFRVSPEGQGSTRLLSTVVVHQHNMVAHNAHGFNVED